MRIPRSTFRMGRMECAKRSAYGRKYDLWQPAGATAMRHGGTLKRRKERVPSAKVGEGHLAMYAPQRSRLELARLWNGRLIRAEGARGRERSPQDGLTRPREV